jgi:hypothetical protein
MENKNVVACDLCNANINLVMENTYVLHLTDGFTYCICNSCADAVHKMVINFKREKGN